MLFHLQVQVIKFPCILTLGYKTCINFRSNELVLVATVMTLSRNDFILYTYRYLVYIVNE